MLLMILMVGLVVVIYLGLRQPKKYCDLVICVCLSLKIVSKQSRSVTLSRCSLGICARVQPLFTRSSLSVPSPSGGAFWRLQTSFSWGESSYYRGHRLIY
jgi:hypothetical protein